MAVEETVSVVVGPEVIEAEWQKKLKSQYFDLFSILHSLVVGFWRRPNPISSLHTSINSVFLPES